MDITSFITAASVLVTFFGAIVGLAQIRKSGRKDNEGEFFSFRLESDRKNAASLTRTVYCAGLAMLSLMVIVMVSGFIDYIPGLINHDLFRVCGTTVVVLSLIANTITNQVLWDKDSKHIDRWIKKSEIKFVVDNAISACFFIGLVSCFIIAALGLQPFGSVGTLIVLLLAIVSMFSAFVSYVRFYYIMRVVYVVTNTKIALTGKATEYDSIHNFRYHDGQLIFIYDKDGTLKKVQTDRDNVLYIEQEIDPEITLIDAKLSIMSKENCNSNLPEKDS